MSRSIGFFFPAACGAALVMALAGPPLAAADDPLAGVQETVGRWSAVRAETIRAETEWEWQRTLMFSTLDVLKERIGQLESRRDELLAKTAGERRELAELGAEREAMQAAESQAAEQLRSLAGRLLELRPALPPRLSSALELPFRSLAAGELSLGERMQHTMTILNRCALFNRGVTFGEEMVTLPGEPPKLMEVAYWGLSRAYALDAAAHRACVGAPAEGVWTWTAAPELEAPVRKLVAIARDRREPELIQLPVTANPPTGADPLSPTP